MNAKKEKHKNILVTGGAGFIGSHLVDTLVSNNSVTVLDDLSNGFKSNVNLKATFIHSDISKKKFFEEFAVDIDLVYHLAAQTSVSVSVANPKLDFEVNFEGTKNILEFCRKKNIPQLIFTSTSAVYGNPVYLPIDEEHPKNPVSPYGKNKLDAEKEIQKFSEMYGLQYTIFRPFNVYGLRMNSSVIDILAKATRKGKNFQINGDGKQTRDFIFVDDVIKVLSLTGLFKNEIINIGTGKETSLNELVEAVKKYYPTLKTVYIKEREGDVRRSVADIKKLTATIQNIRFIELHKGILLI